MKKLYLIIFCAALWSSSYAQVGINTNAPHASAMLDIVSENKGLLPPRLTSDAMVQDPAEGLVIYDESDDCLNVFDGNDWINLCENSGGGGSGGGGVTSGGTSNGDGRFPWANTIPFSTFETNTNQFTMAVSEAGDAYIFGQREARQLSVGFRASDDASVTDATNVTNVTAFGTSNQDPLYAAHKFDDPVLNGKTVKAQAYLQTVLFLNTDGDLYGFGRNAQLLLFPSNSSGYFRKNRPVLIPTLNPGEKIRDFNIDVSRTFILTTEGRFFFKSTGTGGASDFGTANSNGNWQEVAQPAGAAPGFEYTRILTPREVLVESYRAIYLEGNDGEVYGLGEEDVSTYRTFGSATNASGYNNPTISAGVHRINFNLAAGETIEKIRVSEALVTALSSTGKVYVWGNAPATVMPTVSGTGMLVGSNFIEPAEVALPAGETSFRDLHHFNKLTTGIVVVGNSGKVYVYGDVDNLVTTNFPVLQDYTSNYTQLLSWSAIDVVEIQRITDDSLMARDSTGQIWFSGSLVEFAFSAPVLTNTNGVPADADDITRGFYNYLIAIPLFDSAFTSFN